MPRILSKKELCRGIVSLEVESPRIARRYLPGQFIILRVDEKGERIPLTIVDSDPDKGSIGLIFQEVGTTTLKLSRIEVGEEILNVVGPLGKPTECKPVGTVVVIGGGVGTAVAYPIAKAFKEAGNSVLVIIGAKTKDLLILESEMRCVCDELYISTDDGSRGSKGFVSEVLKNLVDQGVKIDLVYAVGPALMMKVIAGYTRRIGVKTIVSLNPIMVDGTGMCGSCRVLVRGTTKFACVDGPEFDAHQVDYDLLIARLRTYLEKERESLLKYEATQGIARK